ncbi:collagen alpha-1(III) chain-like isoform X4 [Photinus pyralis]|uniref:collagen alpha-1(III) chain-like isoform X4 n=1 Tax=Photinus pyralis TaxID=7054 RepID=UPI0012675EF9|nr:collagen alpha-1(III) chain-like isoform X4 [Photinus pyralis]
MAFIIASLLCALPAFLLHDVVTGLNAYPGFPVALSSGAQLNHGFAEILRDGLAKSFPKTFGPPMAGTFLVGLPKPLGPVPIGAVGGFAKPLGPVPLGAPAAAFSAQMIPRNFGPAVARPALNVFSGFPKPLGPMPVGAFGGSPKPLGPLPVTVFNASPKPLGPLPVGAFGGSPQLLGPMPVGAFGGSPKPLGPMPAGPFGGYPQLLGPMPVGAFGGSPKLLGPMPAGPFGGSPKPLGPMPAGPFGGSPKPLGPMPAGPFGGSPQLLGPMPVGVFGGSPKPLGPMPAGPFGGSPQLLGPMPVGPFGGSPKPLGPMPAGPFGGYPQLLGPMPVGAFGGSPKLLGPMPAGPFGGSPQRLGPMPVGPFGGSPKPLGPMPAGPFGGSPKPLGPMPAGPFGGSPQLLGPMPVGAFGGSPKLLGPMPAGPFGGSPQLLGPMPAGPFGGSPQLLGPMPVGVFGGSPQPLGPMPVGSFGVSPKPLGPVPVATPFSAQILPRSFESAVGEPQFRSLDLASPLKLQPSVGTPGTDAAHKECDYPTPKNRHDGANGPMVDEIFYHHHGVHSLTRPAFQVDPGFAPPDNAESHPPKETDGTPASHGDIVDPGFSHGGFAGGLIDPGFSRPAFPGGFPGELIDPGFSHPGGLPGGLTRPAFHGGFAGGLIDPGFAPHGFYGSLNGTWGLTRPAFPVGPMVDPGFAPGGAFNKAVVSPWFSLGATKEAPVSNVIHAELEEHSSPSKEHGVHPGSTKEKQVEEKKPADKPSIHNDHGADQECAPHGGFAGGLIDPGFSRPAFEGGFAGGLIDPGFSRPAFQGGFAGGLIDPGFSRPAFQGGFAGGLIDPGFARPAFRDGVNALVEPKTHKDEHVEVTETSPESHKTKPAQHNDHGKLIDPGFTRPAFPVGVNGGAVEPKSHKSEHVEEPETSSKSDKTKPAPHSDHGGFAGGLIDPGFSGPAAHGGFAGGLIDPGFSGPAAHGGFAGGLIDPGFSGPASHAGANGGVVEPKSHKGEHVEGPETSSKSDKTKPAPHSDHGGFAGGLVDPGFSHGGFAGGLIDPGFSGPASHGGFAGGLIDPGFSGPAHFHGGFAGGLIDPGFAPPGFHSFGGTLNKAIVAPRESPKEKHAEGKEESSSSDKPTSTPATHNEHNGPAGLTRPAFQGGFAGGLLDPGFSGPASHGGFAGGLIDPGFAPHGFHSFGTFNKAVVAPRFAPPIESPKENHAEVKEGSDKPTSTSPTYNDHIGLTRPAFQGGFPGALTRPAFPADPVSPGAILYLNSHAKLPPALGGMVPLGWRPQSTIFAMVPSTWGIGQTFPMPLVPAGETEDDQKDELTVDLDKLFPCDKATQMTVLKFITSLDREGEQKLYEDLKGLDLEQQKHHLLRLIGKTVDYFAVIDNGPEKVNTLIVI